MRIERHIFGSYSGYTTLARSSGISAEDARFLESGAYSFGQNNDSRFVKTLNKTPAYFTRALSGGRRALTRVLEGNQDDNNRPTLCLVTLVLSQRDWDAELWGDVEVLLGNADLWAWDGSPSLNALEIAPALPSPSIPRKSVAKVLTLVSEVEKALAARRTVLVSPDDYALSDLRALEMLIPPGVRSKFTTGYRTLSPQLPVTVNCLSSEAAALARPTFRYQSGANHLSPYAEFLQASGLESGTMPIHRLVEYRQFGAVASAANVAPAASPVLAQTTGGSSPWPAVLIGAVGLVVAVASFFVGRSVGSGEATATERAKQQQERLRVDQEHAAALAASVADVARVHEDKLKAAFSVAGPSYDAILDQAKIKFVAASEDGDATRKLREETEKLRAFYDAEKARHRERFQAIKGEFEAAAGRIDTHSLPALERRVAGIDGELKSVREDWPWVAEGDKGWLTDLKKTKARVEALKRDLARLDKVTQILEECEQEIRQFNPDTAKDTMGNVRASFDQLHGEIRGLPDHTERSGMDLGAFKGECRERAKHIEKWLAEKEKPAKPREKPRKGEKAPGSDARPGGLRGDSQDGKEPQP